MMAGADDGGTEGLCGAAHVVPDERDGGPSAVLVESELADRCQLPSGQPDLATVACRWGSPGLQGVAVQDRTRAFVRICTVPIGVFPRPA